MVQIYRMFSKEDSYINSFFVLILIARYKESELIKLDIQINGERVEPLATIVHKDKVTQVFPLQIIILLI